MKELEHAYDFVVVGGGLAGLCAAVTAARAGLHTALIQDRPVLGGNSSKEIRVPPVGARCCNFAYSKETGLVENLLLENLRTNPTCSPEGWNLVLINCAKREPNLHLFFNTVITQAETADDGQRLAVLRGYTLNAETWHTFRARYFADCTGEGTIGILTGAPFRWGIEARGEFGESMAEEVPQHYTMGSSIWFTTRDAGRPVAFERPHWVTRVINEEDFGRFRSVLSELEQQRGGFWWLELGGERDMIHDAPGITDDLHALIYGVWDYLKMRIGGAQSAPPPSQTGQADLPHPAFQSAAADELAQAKVPKRSERTRQPRSPCGPAHPVTGGPLPGGEPQPSGFPPHRRAQPCGTMSALARWPQLDSQHCLPTSLRSTIITRFFATTDALTPTGPFVVTCRGSLIHVTRTSHHSVSNHLRCSTRRVPLPQRWPRYFVRASLCGRKLANTADRIEFTLSAHAGERRYGLVVHFQLLSTREYRLDAVTFSYWPFSVGQVRDFHPAVPVRSQAHNRSALREKIATWELDWVGTLPGKRETRRFEGDHILSQCDIEQQRPFEDAVACGGWGFDHHPKDGFFDRHRPSFHVYHSGPYNIPLRSLYSRKVTNLFLPGRNISATHYGLSSTRVMLTCAQLGEAVGTAAAVSLRHKLLPRELLPSAHVAEVQEALLKGDHHLYAVPYRDEKDLGQKATVTASSVLPGAGMESSAGVVPPNGERLWQFPVVTSELKALEVLLAVARPTELSYRIYAGPRNGSTYPETELLSGSIKLQAGNQQWVVLPAQLNVARPGWHFLTLAGNPAVGVHFGRLAPVGMLGYDARNPDPIRINRFSSWKVFKSSGAADVWNVEDGVLRVQTPDTLDGMVADAYCLRITPAQSVYEPANVVNPWSRPTHLPNLWISRPTEFAQPEFLDLHWSRPQRIGAVTLLFDSALDFHVTRLWMSYKRNTIPSIVRDYRLYARDEAGAWVVLVEEKGNCQRRRHLTFSPVTTQTLRVECRATNGLPRAQIYAVRAYGPTQ